MGGCALLCWCWAGIQDGRAGSSVVDLRMLFCKVRRAQVAADEVPSTCD